VKKIIISPWSKLLRTPGKPNPKNPPLVWWKEVVNLLKQKDIYIIQIGINGEEPIGANEIQFNLSLQGLKELTKKCDTFISVDNFFPHLTNLVGKPGIVVWAKSSPKIYGYPTNINLLKDEKYLRTDQFGTWEECNYDLNAFVEPQVVVNSVLNIFEK